MNSLGFDKAPAETRVVVAMSGGVDSSVVAAMLKEEGYDVIGMTLQLYDHGAAIEKKGSCCAGQDIYDARRVAETMGFPHYVLNYESRFRQNVIDDFADSYLRGETPIPCVRCNQTVKFNDLLKMARELDADCLATGHYIRRVEGADGAELHRGLDPVKDQSYFLFATTPEQLAFLRFPLGGLTKDETRALAEKYHLPVAAKPDSQGICFVPDGDYARIVQKLRPESARPGNIVHLDGRILGTHEGTIHYTIGQRKGLGIGGGHSDNNEPFYVVALRPERNEVVAGPYEALARDIAFLKDCNWLLPEIPADGLEISVKLRSMQPLSSATLYAGSGSIGGGTDDTARIALHTPQFGVAAGQAAVCYLGDRMIGGGWITGSACKHENEQKTAA